MKTQSFTYVVKAWGYWRPARPPQAAIAISLAGCCAAVGASMLEHEEHEALWEAGCALLAELAAHAGCLQALKAAGTDNLVATALRQHAQCPAARPATRFTPIF